MIASENIAIRTVRRQDLPLLYALSQDFSNAGEFMPVSLVSESEFYNTFDQNGFWQGSCGRLVIEDNQHNIVGERCHLLLKVSLQGRYTQPTRPL